MSGAISSIFGGGPKTVAPPPLVAPVTEDTEAVKEAARREADRLKRRRGFQSTILTGPAGVSGSVPGTKAVLG